MKVKVEWGYSTTIFDDAERKARGDSKRICIDQGSRGSMDKATVRPGGWGRSRWRGDSYPGG